MALRRRPRTQPEQHRWSVTASGRLLARGLGAAQPTPASWAAEAWSLYDRVGELHYMAGHIGSLLSRVALVPTVPSSAGGWMAGTDTDGAPVSPAASVALDVLSQLEPRAELLRSIGVCLTIEGECRLVGRRTEPGWEALSSLELTWDGQSWARTGGPGGPVPMGDSDVVRIWRPHPRMRAQADSPTLGALGVLRQMAALGDAIIAACQSRLLLGLLRYPAELDLPTSDVAGSDAEASPFQTELIELAARSFRDPASAARLVPLVVPVPSDMPAPALSLVPMGQHFEHFPVAELLERATQRMARAMDTPVETLTGYESSTFANAREAAESLIRDHVEPLATLVAASLADALVAPALEDAGMSPWSASVGHDVSALRIPPDRAGMAGALVSLGVISPAAARRAAGFGDADAPEVEPGVVPAPDGRR